MKRYDFHRGDHAAVVAGMHSGAHDSKEKVTPLASREIVEKLDGKAATGSPVKGVPTSTDSHRYVGFAKSNDGLTWQRHGDTPVFGNDAGGIDVKHFNDGYVLLYESHGGTRYAKSGDGIRWEDAGWPLYIRAQESGSHVLRQ